MTNARSDLYSPGDAGYYHCISRCVRRGFLCGYDYYTKKSYEHRKEWVRDRLRQLLDIFAIECLSYAVMSTHLHTLLHVRPDISATWSEEEIFRRWRLLFPKQPRLDMSEEESYQAELAEFCCQPQLVEKYRLRLSDLSWFHRCLNENVARRANSEDDCTGRFWEGRFKCQRVLGDNAIICCSVYVDLNPIRAGVAKTPEASDFTSVQDRIRAHKLKTRSKRPTPKLVSFPEAFESMSELDYLELVDTTARRLVGGKHSMSDELEPILKRLGITESGWLLNIKSQSTLFRRVIGKFDLIKDFAAKRSRCFFHGLRAAKRVFA